MIVTLETVYQAIKQQIPAPYVLLSGTLEAAHTFVTTTGATHLAAMEDMARGLTGLSENIKQLEWAARRLGPADITWHLYHIANAVANYVAAVLAHGGKQTRLLRQAQRFVQAVQR